MIMRMSVLAAAVAALSCFMPATRGDTVIDASRAIKIALPTVSGPSPVSFKTPDGKDGWVVKLSNDSIPTPAFANGKILTGTGVSGHLFYALNANTGETIWAKTGRENGPTSPVVSGRYVCYNTESCDTETRDIESGEMVWEETTGGSLLTQPVVSGDMFVIPHPTMTRRQNADNVYRMLAVDTKDGKHSWDANMTADVTGAPISAAGRVYFSCTDGRLFAMSMRGGAATWHVVANATSAPVVVGQTLAVTTEEKRLGGGAVVSIRRFNVDNGDLVDKDGIAPVVVASAVDVQRTGWDYQGPKIAAANRKLFNAPGQVINSVDMDTGKTLWQTTVRGNDLSNASNSLTPPALGSKTLYLGSQKGHILAVKQENGMLAYAYNVGVPLATQPLLVDGNLYFGTANGMLVCLKMKDADAKNWTAWGGNSEHNKVD